MKKLMLATILAFGITSVYAADTKPVPKVDCTQKKNAKKPQCQKAPESKVKPKIAAPADKSVRKAPASVQKKAEANKAAEK